MNRAKVILVYLGFFILFVHFFFVLVYLTDGKYTPPGINAATEWYIRPIFHQSWKLFAPDPPLWDVGLIYRSKMKDEKWTKWEDPGFHWLLKHYFNRFSYYGKMYMIHTRIARTLYNSALNCSLKQNNISLNEVEGFNEKIRTTEGFRLAAQYIRKVSCEKFKGKEIEKLQFAYVARITPDFKDRMKLKEEKKIKVIWFPEFAFKNE